MKIYLDSASLIEIRDLANTNLIDGITTNPSLIAKSGKKNEFKDLVSEICSIMNEKPVSIEVISKNSKEMVEEGLDLIRIAKNVVVKLPLTYEGLIACNKLSREYNVKVNITLCFSPGQALLAAKAGACFISPFIGRLDDISYNGLSLIEDIRTIYSNYEFNTQILVASVRNPIHVIEAAKLGADITTIPAKIFEQLVQHPLTDKGLAIFEKDWT
ncbi:MAG: fructose-6-phosphate aldolase [Wolbachia endosymbiont of Fragariocoptes setiger]|nr:fructose-6-phosphate aldolase [Wolbachia endosymbiont of Fragariocoptes setiger]